MMALTIEQNVTIDVLNPRRNIIHVVQEDSTRVIRLTLLANNLPYNVEATETETVLKFVEFRKPDGHGGMYDTTSTGETAVQLEDSNVPNVWLIALDGQCFTFPGWTQINIRFETESGRRIHTFPIFVDVEPTASSDTESTDWGELNSIADLRNAVAAMWDKMFPPDAKQALLKYLKNIAYFKDGHASEYYDELEAALFQTAEIVSISAVFEQGEAVIYDTDDLETLRQYLTVTAVYEDLSEREVTGYTLSGTLTEGTSTITVSYGGKTATFDVTVSAESILPRGFRQLQYIECNGGAYFSVAGASIAVKSGSKVTSIAMQTEADANTTRHATGGGTANYYVGFLNFFDDGTVGGSYGTNSAKAKTTWDSSVVGKKVTCVYSKPASGNFSVAVTIDGVTKTATATLPENKPVDPVRVGWLGVANQAFKGREYEMFCVNSSNVEVFHFYPCVRESDNAVGMYDLVNNDFHGSDTSTPFVAGPNA